VREGPENQQHSNDPDADRHNQII